MPAQAGAFDACREFAHTRERGEFAQIGRRGIGLRQQCVHLVEHRADAAAVAAFDRFGHQRGRGHRNRTAIAVKLQVGNDIALQVEGDRELIATQWIVSVGERIRRIESPKITRVAVVV